MDNQHLAELKKAHRILNHATEPPESVLKLLCNTTIGTNGAKYTLGDTPQRIKALNQPHFFYLERNHKAVGNITICERPIQLNQSTFKGYYIRYFAFQQIFQGSTQTSASENKFHLYFKRLFESSQLNPLIKDNAPSVYWAFIDPENLKSFKMREKFNFQSIGTFNTFIFHRFFPKRNHFVSAARMDEFDLIRKEATLFFQQHQFYSTIRLNPENYWVMRNKEGNIIAGVKCFPSTWRIHQLPGKNGKLLQRILPIIPFSKRLINPKENKFLATEGFWYKPEAITQIESFFSSILAEYNLNSIYLWEDDKSNALKRLNLKWGSMEKLKKDNPIHVVAKFNHFESDAIQQIKNSPKYLSGFDMT